VHVNVMAVGDVERCFYMSGAADAMNSQAELN
jgi:hypothetical protein